MGTPAERGVQVLECDQNGSGFEDGVTAQVGTGAMRRDPDHLDLGPHETPVGDRTTSSVGSVTMAASTLTRPRTSCTPRLECSSSETAATRLTSGQIPAERPRGTRSALPEPSFHVVAGRARTGGPHRRGVGARSPFGRAPTVSACPHSRRGLPAARRARLDDHRGTAGDASSSRWVTSPAWPAKSSMKSAAAVSPAAPDQPWVYGIDSDERPEDLNNVSGRKSVSSTGNPWMALVMVEHR